jgi:hypothetical protein
VDKGAVVANGVLLSASLLERPAPSGLSVGAAAVEAPAVYHPWHAHPLRFAPDPLGALDAARHDRTARTLVVTDAAQEVAGEACVAAAEALGLESDPHFFHGRRQLRNGDVASLRASLPSGVCAVQLHRNSRLAVVRADGLAVDESCLGAGEVYAVAVAAGDLPGCTVAFGPRGGDGLCVERVLQAEGGLRSAVVAAGGRAGDHVLAVRGVRKLWTPEAFEEATEKGRLSGAPYALTLAKTHNAHSDRLWTCAGHWQPGGCRGRVASSDGPAFACAECSLSHRKNPAGDSSPGFCLCTPCFNLGLLARTDLEIGSLVEVTFHRHASGSFNVDFPEKEVVKSFQHKFP